MTEPTKLKVFISWSEERSRQIGEALREWLPGALQGVEPFFSPDDVAKGTRWTQGLAEELESCSFGIFCLTPEALGSDWVLFEAGAISKLGKSRVCGILFGLGATDVTGPLTQFQLTPFEKKEMKKLFRDINALLGNMKLPDTARDRTFEKWWDDLERDVKKIMETTIPGEQKPERTDREILEEILTLVRSGERRRGRPPTGELPDSITVLDLYSSLEKLRVELRDTANELRDSPGPEAMIRAEKLLREGEHQYSVLTRLLEDSRQTSRTLLFLVQTPERVRAYLNALEYLLTQLRGPLERGEAVETFGDKSGTPPPADTPEPTELDKDTE